MKVSVIIPFYKVEAYIARCVKSLLAQTLDDVEFIFVDDASPDRSAEIVRDLIEGSGRNARIVRHEVNKGLPAARNTGIALSKGDYIYHCDSDDWLEPEMIERLYRAAVEVDADLAYCDFYLDFGESRRRLSNPDFHDGITMVREGYFAGTAKFNVWNKLARTNLYQGISFPEGHAMGEDMTMIPVTARASRVVRVPEALYHYFKQNPGAYSNSFSKGLDDVKFNLCRALGSVSDYPFSEKDKAFFKLNTKLPFLMSGDKQQFRLWKEWFPEANRYIKENHYLPARTRIVQQCAAHNLFFLVKMYCFAVNMFYSGYYKKTR